MSGFKRHLTNEKSKSSSSHRESERSLKNNLPREKRMKLEKSTCPISELGVKENERQSTKVSGKKEKHRTKSQSPSNLMIGRSSSAVCPSLTSNNNSFLMNTYFENDRDEVMNSSLQRINDTEYPDSYNRDISVKPGFVNPSCTLNSNKTMYHNSKQSFSFNRSMSSRGESTITSRDVIGSLSPEPDLVQPENYGFHDLLSQTEENTTQSLNPDYETNYLNKDIARTEKQMVISDDDLSEDDLQTDLTCIDNDSENVYENDVVSEESEPLQVDPALRQFDVIDEIEASDQEEGEIMESNSEESNSEIEEELPIDDIDEMLDEGLPEKFKSSENKERVVKLRRKAVLEEIGHDHFDLLPEGWIKIMHGSGMPVYLHQKSRVCTMARPYYLGPGSSRNHKVPLSAIPCLHYKRASELEKKNKEEREKKQELQNQQSQSEIELMSAEIETFEENKATQSLEASELHEYCNKAFKFKTVTLIPFKSWADRRKYVKMRRELQKKQRPTLPGGTKLLKFPIKNPDGTVSKSKGEWTINPNGKSYVCILHEYVQHALKKHPKYQFKELENPATPYSATVFIEDVEYGFGMGASKKHAKVEAAKAALEVLIPGMKDKIEPDSQSGEQSGTTKKSNDTDISIFDQIKVEDPRVAEFCAKSTEPPPYAILLTCLGRNTGVGEIELSYEMNSKSFKPGEFTMTVGNHKATVACRNKREGKQRAAQAILKAIHPNIIYWGSLLRMYGNRSIKDIKEKKKEEQEITQLQSKASLNQPNYAILEKLRTELLKLREKREALKAKGTFTLPENIVLPSLSSTDLNKVNL